MVLLVNGLPLVLIEAKTPVKKCISWVDGAIQVHDDYEKFVPELFVCNVFSVATEGKLFREQLEEARIKAEEWRIQREREHAIYQEKERIRQEEEAYNASRTELNSIMAQWAEDKRMEQFFREAELDAAGLGEQQKVRIMERLQLARQFLSGDSAVEQLLKWKTPQERLNKA